MQVTGFVNVNDHEQADVLGRECKVTVQLANGTTEEFTGKIGFASPIVQPGGEYRVWTRIENRQRGKFWILRPGVRAQLTISIR